MKKKQDAIPRHIVVDTSTGEVVGVAKRSRTPIAVAVMLALALVACISIYAYIHTQPAQEPERTTQAETDRDSFLESRKEAWENAEEGVTYFVDDDGNQVFIPEKYRDNPQEWIDQVGK